MNDEDRLTVVNVVASTRVAEELDLPDIAIQLNCEYEPEQFPGVVYRVKDPKLAILMFRSGRAVCTGGKNEDNIHSGIERMMADLQNAGITTWDLSQTKQEVEVVCTTNLKGEYDNNDWIADEAFIKKVEKFRSAHDDKEKMKKKKNKSKAKEAKKAKKVKKAKPDSSEANTPSWGRIEVGSKLRGGVGATLTTGSPITIDGTKLARGHRVLLVGQKDAKQNGLYELKQIKGGVLIRTQDADNHAPENIDGVPFEYGKATSERKVMTGMNVLAKGETDENNAWVLVSRTEIAIGETNKKILERKGATAEQKFITHGEAIAQELVSGEPKQYSGENIWVEGKSGDVEIEVQNMVATYALHHPEDYDGKARMDDHNLDIKEGDPLAGLPRKLNLNNLTFHLPFDKVEYEPEQFPGLIYRLDYPKVVCLIFGSGKMVITGARHKDEILEAVQIIQDELADLL